MIQLCLGALYAWKAFTGKLVAEPYNFSKLQSQIPFNVGLVTFAVVMAFIAGRWQQKIGPRKVAMVGGIVFGLGYLIAGFSGNSFIGILIGVGVFGGAGIGLVYVVPIAVCVKWFPDKKGMITGLAVAGFGFGALIWIKLTSGFVFGPVNFTPGWDGLYGMDWGISGVFKLYGVLFTVIVVLGSLLMVNPPDGWKPPGKSATIATTALNGGVEFTELQMVKTPQFWMLYFIFTAGAMAGLMVIGIIGLFGKDALTANGITLEKADIIAGTAMGLFFAFMNGFGRIAWGTISEKTGRKAAIVMMTGFQGIMMILFYFIGGYEWGLYLGAAIIGFNYGGIFSLFPAATADYFGNKSVGVNYPWVFMAYGLGGSLGPILGGAMGDHELWVWAFIPAGIACLIAAGVGMLLKPPQHHTPAAA